MNFCPVKEVPTELKPLWEVIYPGRYEFEIRVLKNVVGGSLQADLDALQKGVLILRFEWPDGEQQIPLIAAFPDSYPRLRPIVRLNTSHEKYPNRHCSPIDGTLCLLGRDSRQWKPSLTLAKLLTENLSHALHGTGQEDEQGEPLEYWWNYLGKNGSYCLVDSDWDAENSTKGELKFHFHYQTVDGNPIFKSVVTEFNDQTGKTLEKWRGVLPSDLTEGNCKIISIPWIRIQKPLPPTGKAGQIIELSELFENIPTVSLSQTKLAKIFAIAYDSELTFQKKGLGWLFACLYGGRKQMRGLKPLEPNIIRTYRAGPQDLGGRVPAVKFLRKKNIGVFGVGALGAPLALEIARNGCRKLHLVDGDNLEPGNSIRWPLGTSVWGQPKVSALSNFIKNEYPWTKPEAHNQYIGVVSEKEPQKGDNNLFSAIFDEVDLVVDATVSHGVTAILNDHCRERNLPLVSLFATPSLEGGVVAYFNPKGGCPTCLELAWKSSEINKPDGWDNETDLQQPPGCSELTFTGASFDLQELTLQAMRLIVEILNNSDPDQNSKILTLRLASDGKSTPPQWKIDTLPKNSECSCSQ